MSLSHSHLTVIQQGSLDEDNICSHDDLIHTLVATNWLYDILHFTSSHQRFILKFVNTIPLPLKYSSALIQASHSICRSLILCWISKILFTGAHLTYSDALSRRSNIFPSVFRYFHAVSAAAWRLSWRPQVRWRRSSLSLTRAWAAILRCHHTPIPRSGDTGHWAECISVIIVGRISLYSYLHHIISFVRTTSSATVGFR